MYKQSVGEMLKKYGRVYGWNMDDFTTKDFSHVAIIKLQTQVDNSTRHATMLDIGHKFEKFGFNVKFFNQYTDEVKMTDDYCPESLKELVDHLHVSIVRAEDKLRWATMGKNSGNISPNFVGLLATGPLLREEGTQPRRVVLHHNPRAFKPYVTHVQCVPDGTGDMCNPYLDNGHYFTEQEKGKAVADFTQRVNSLHINVYPDDADLFPGE